MPRGQLTRSPYFKRAGSRLPLAAVAAAVCLSHAFALAPAQSGRKTKQDAPAPPPPVAADAQADKTSGRIQSLIIVGHDTDSEYKIITSKHPDTLAKFCEERLKQSRVRTTISRGGRMGRAKAIELARREQHAHVLWFEFMTRRVGLSDIIERVDYFILAPRTAEMLFTGQLRIKHNTMPRGGPIPRIPGVQTNVRLIEDQLREAGRELADRVRDKL